MIGVPITDIMSPIFVFLSEENIEFILSLLRLFATRLPILLDVSFVPSSFVDTAAPVLELLLFKNGGFFIVSKMSPDFVPYSFNALLFSILPLIASIPPSTRPLAS